VTWLLVALLLTVNAPASLGPDADRIRRSDTTRLSDALEQAGLSLPPEIEITLIANDDARARSVPSSIAGFAVGDRDIVIFPERVLSYPYDSLESVVRHEVAHLALNLHARGAPLPRWFHEGVAVSVDAGWTLSAQFRLLVAMLARPDIARLTQLFASDSASETEQAYLLSALLVDDLRRRHGSDLPGRIASRISDGVPFEAAFDEETGLAPDAAAARAWAGYRRWTAWVPAVTSPSAAWTLILALAFLAFIAQRRRRARRRRQWDDEASPLTQD
jgi:hypothetical protein